jgi:hypothetical protein
MEATISASSTEDSRYLAVKAVGAGFLVLLISTLLARAVTALVTSTSAPHVLWGVTVDVNRIREFTTALPEIAERSENAAFFVGGSVVFYGFSPKVFDARMREHAIDLRSYNVGVNGNVPEVDALTVRRIGDAYTHASRRVRVMMIAFGAWAFADWFTGLNPNRNRSRLVKSAALLTETEIASLFLHEPHYASELLGVRILGGFGAPDSIGLLGERMFGGPANGAVSPSWWFGADPPAPEPYEQAVQDARRGWGLQFGHWNDSVRGEFFQDRGDDEACARLASFAVKPSEERIKWYDDKLKGDMKVRPELFAQFLESVRLAQGFSDAVVVVVIPSNPVAGRLNAEGRRHFEEIKAEMRRTGASVLDLFEPPELTMADYLDISHLNEQTGKPIFSALLADRVADVLARQKR